MSETTGADAFSRSTKHGPRLDEEMERETHGRVQGGHATRAQEWRDPEPAGEDQPSGDVRIVPEDRRGTPHGMSQSDVDTRADIAMALGKGVYPADRETLVLRALESSAPDRVLSMLRSLPADQEFDNVNPCCGRAGGCRPRCR